MASGKGKPKQTDNHRLAGKLELRRHFLRKYHAAGDADVMDCCQGTGQLWTHLRAEFKVRSYWGLDLKPKEGRLRVDSSRILEQAGWTQNVIDIDTYGFPWKHWHGLLPNVERPLTVFLTLGINRIGQGGVAVDNHTREVMGLGDMEIPASFGMKIIASSLNYHLAVCTKYGILITEAVEAVSTVSARYFGLRLELAGASAQQQEDESHGRENGDCVDGSHLQHRVGVSEG